LHDALRVGSYQHVGSDLARDGTLSIGAHREARDS
jgi:hypothetical protein